MKVVVLNNFAIGETHLGKSVFAARSFKRGDVVTQFEGEILHKSQIPKTYRGEGDRYMQIGVDEYLGPSGNTDDLINHSCEPNCGLKFTKSGVLLVAIKNINVGDEITWDYSTTLFENSWRMKCDCRSTLCRKIIGDFALLDQALQKKYQRFGVIPPYIKAYLMSQEYSVYTKGIQHLSRHEGKEK